MRTRAAAQVLGRTWLVCINLGDVSVPSAAVLSSHPPLSNKGGLRALGHSAWPLMADVSLRGGMDSGDTYRRRSRWGGLTLSANVEITSFCCRGGNRTSDDKDGSDAIELMVLLILSLLAFSTLSLDMLSLFATGEICFSLEKRMPVDWVSELD
jgi:hypothetical protein